MTDTELEALIECAKKATPGPWKYDWGNWSVEVNNLGAENHRVDVCSLTGLNDAGMPGDPMDGEFIAAANPAVVIEIAEELKRHRVAANQFSILIPADIELHFEQAVDTPLGKMIPYTRRK